MSPVKYRIPFLSMAILILFASALFAGTTGKIAGKVMDKETGEPLPGVNVLVKGTALGASSSIDGYYVILNVPPGNQTVIASMVGYATVTVTDIAIRIDQTSNINIELIPQAIQATGVEVVAERKIVKQDVSSSVAAIQPEDIKNLPVTSINDVISLQAGVDQGLTIRGGDASQLLFQMDGATLRDPRNNKPVSTSIAMNNIQELSIERGGFSAEYGQVRSGIINIVTKEGDAQKYSGAITYKYAPPQPKYFGMSVFDPNSMWNRVFLDPNVCWTGTDNPVNPSTWDTYTARQYPYFQGWNALSQQLIKGGGPYLTPAALQRVWEYTHRRTESVNSPDYSVDAGLGGPVPIVGSSLGNARFYASLWLNREMLLIPQSRPDYLEYNGTLKLNSDISSGTSLMISATTGKSYNVAMNPEDQQFYNPSFGITGLPDLLNHRLSWSPTDYLQSPLDIAEVTNEQRASRIFDDNWYSSADVGHYSIAAKLTKFISAATFYEVSIQDLHTDYLTGPTYVRDTTTKYEVVPGFFEDEAPYGFWISPTDGYDPSGMFLGSHNAAMRDSSKFNSLDAKVDFTSQVNEENLIKTGIDFSYYNLKLDYAEYDDYYGIDNFVKQNWNPYRLSMYAQDKIETHGFIANLGLRLDLSNPNSEWANVPPFDPSYFSYTYTDTANYPKQKAKIDATLSPRLGISHPITENSKLYFNYGQFKEYPAYEEIFRIGRGAGGSMENYGNPNLQQSKTTSYELGFEQALFNSYLLQLAAFYNDITDEQNYVQYIGQNNGVGYYLANNNGYEDVRGLEVTLRKNYGDWIRGFLTYTYQVTTQGFFGRQTVSQDPSQQIIIDETTTNYYQSKWVPQPRATADLILVTPTDFGSRVLGAPSLDRWLGDWNANVVGTWRAGEWMTWNPQQKINVVNNVQTSDYYTCDLSIDKMFDFKSVSITFIVDVRNVFNLKRLSGKSFYDIYDYNYYMESLHLPQSSDYDNIPGSDRAGDVRKAGVAFQPIQQVGSISGLTPSQIEQSAIYYDISTKHYMQYTNGNWSQVPGAKMQQILNDKAYIDMPNNSSFDFLNPRQVFFGINFQFKL